MTNGLKLLVIGCGCFFGGVLRYACEVVSDLWIKPPFADPLAVLIVNAVGCFIIGLFTGWALKKNCTQGLAHDNYYRFLWRSNNFFILCSGNYSIVYGRSYLGWNFLYFSRYDFRIICGLRWSFPSNGKGLWRGVVEIG